MKSFKILLVGNSGVGKTTFIKQYMHEYFDPSYRATEGTSIYSTVLNTSKGRIQLNILDTSGQEKYAEYRRLHYTDADAVCAMYSVDTVRSAVELSFWLAEKQEVNPSIPIFYIGNKCELEQKVTDQTLNELFSKYPGRHCTISTRKRTNIDAPFLDLVRHLLNDDSVTLV